MNITSKDPFIKSRVRGIMMCAAKTDVSDDRIRVAYLCGDFHEHPVAILTVELFELHDRSRFEVHAISVGPKVESPFRSRLEKSFDHWHDVWTMEDREVAKLIQDIGIDIVVDLSGHTTNARHLILAPKPAPIQVSYLGFPATLGADFIDYILVDQFVAPPGHDGFYTEKLVRLPNCYMVHDSKRKVAGEIPSRTDCGLPEDGFVFCCFNRSYKITPMIFDVWMRLLTETPGSVMWLSDSGSWARDNLRREATRRNVLEERLIFASRLPEMSDHLARHRQADLFLDTPIFNAHTTAIDALWAGLPVLTCSGSSFSSRVAGSLLQAVGLPELMTTDLADYEALALKLTREPGLLAGYTERLALKRSTAPLFNSQRSTDGLEAAYTRMYQRWRDGKPSKSFSVDDY